MGRCFIPTDFSVVHKKKASVKPLSTSCMEAHIKEARKEGTIVSKARNDNTSSRMHGQPLEDGGEENGQSSPIVLAEGKEMEGTGDKVKAAGLESCQQWERREGMGRKRRMCILPSRKPVEVKCRGGEPGTGDWKEGSREGEISGSQR